ncbi:NAD(P)-dependent oxidoreductase [Frankia sp. QA3]|uniref:NAD(P)-dependent oxidoreductase n=1 Tax=Frankia sp. QA3 TaxID=710111 RepID=UPI000269CDD8|nr:NAD(P)-dependent oxidoreductase [Frankia sp. QA3]EIV95706.1 beta-hydroxyacid dehydrogenase, 3-hydroxyisobutyrate dehydrogenase [Frankia sp. QA3]
MQVAFVGLGTMGFPMAGHLARAGFDTVVFNRTAATAARWSAAYPGRVAATPAQAAAGADVVCVCVGADDDVRAVLLGPDGALGALVPGATIVDHTTTSAELAVEIAQRAAAAGVGFVDAPVSGGQAGAEAGRLSVMCGGEADTVERVRPVLAAYGATITRIGPVGTGQLTKMVNQILVAGAVEGAAEALNFAMAAGLDLDRVLPAVSGGAASSWYLTNRAATMIRDEFDFGFAVDWMRKDLRICLAEAARRGVPVPLTELAESDLAASQARGDGQLDATAVIRLRRLATAQPAADDADDARPAGADRAADVRGTASTG